jgi:hypothetical protein
MLSIVIRSVMLPCISAFGDFSCDFGRWLGCSSLLPLFSLFASDVQMCLCLLPISMLYLYAFDQLILPCFIYLLEFRSIP